MIPLKLGSDIRTAALRVIRSKKNGLRDCFGLNENENTERTKSSTKIKK